uniref:Myocardial zonula adherens protein n=1 Tax=Oryzias melastigma TaxID=30732 RepID=A0A3B3B7T6_ORYME
MLSYGSRPTVSTTTTTTEDSLEVLRERRIRRLRLTLHAGENGHKEGKTADTNEAEKNVSETWKKKNGLIHRERPAGRESPQQHLGDATNGVSRSPLHHGPKVYGVVQRTSADSQPEVTAQVWPVSHLHDEMRYIREVRDSLEKVRERMYGQFGGMQQSIEKLSQELRVSNSLKRNLESEVKTRRTAMDSFDQMNSSLISANIDLQKSLLENCQNRVDMRQEVKNLRSTFEKTQEKLMHKEQELAAAHAENQMLKLQVEASREAGAQSLRDLSAKLQKEYEEKLHEEQQKHREEIEKLQARLDEYIKRLEEVERNLKIAEQRVAEKDQRIMEVDRLLDCMGKEKSHLQCKLQECEQRLRLIEMNDTTDAFAAKRSKELRDEAMGLRERIKHLNDMVFCQQKKIKALIEEVQSLRTQVAQKDMFISELLDRIAIVECENNELEDKLKYFMSIQNKPQEVAENRDCDEPPRHAAHRHEVNSVQFPPARLPPMQLPPLPEPVSPVEAPSPTPLSPHSQPPSPISSPSPAEKAVQPSSPSPPSSPIKHSSPYSTMHFQSRSLRPFNPPPSRLESSLLRCTPAQYRHFLQSYQSAPDVPRPDERAVPTGRDEVDAPPSRDVSTLPPNPSQRAGVYTPFMKLMEMTANLNIE